MRQTQTIEYKAIVNHSEWEFGELNIDICLYGKDKNANISKKELFKVIQNHSFNFEGKEINFKDVKNIRILKTTIIKIIELLK